MIKLNYNPTYKFSSVDIFDYADSEPITFEAHSRQTSEWARLVRQWASDGGNDPARAAEIVGAAIVAVEQGGERYPIGSTENAQGLRDAIEESAPGHGDRWLCNLALGHWNYHFSRAETDLGNSAAPSEVSSNGAAAGSKSGRTAQSRK